MQALRLLQDNGPKQKFLQPSDQFAPQIMLTEPHKAEKAENICEAEKL